MKYELKLQIKIRFNQIENVWRTKHKQNAMDSTWCHPAISPYARIETKGSMMKRI